MTDLVACLSSGEKSQSHVERLINGQDWSSVIIITSELGRKNFKSAKEVDWVVVDFQKPVFELIADIQKGIKGKLTGLEVALNIVSGNGKEHMAILSALLKLGLGIRLMAVTKEGIREL